MSEIIFLCERCGISIEASDTLCGGTVVCPNCHGEVRVPAPLLQEGLDLNGFVLEKMLGAGGMGQVWLAHQTAMERKVALKILDPNLAKSTEFVERFLREAKMLAKLVHNNILTAYDAGYSRGIYFMAVCFIDGFELGKKLEEEGLLPEKHALEIAASIAEGLCYAWNKYKIIHRDIKPANIMIDSDGVPKLMDLGISKSMEDKSLTMTGVVVGTPYYISPEQGKGIRQLDFRSDVYSLGATLYHLVTGDVPYNGPTTISIITQHITEPFPPPQLKNPNVSDQCSALLETMMAKKPEQRQQSWEDVIRDMRNVLEGEFPGSKRPAAGETVIGGKPAPGKTSGIGVPRKTSVEIPFISPPKTGNLQFKIAMVAILVLMVFVITAVIVTKVSSSLRKNETPKTDNIAGTVPGEEPKTEPAVSDRSLQAEQGTVQTLQENRIEQVRQPVNEPEPEHEKAPELVNLPDKLQEMPPKIHEDVQFNIQEEPVAEQKPEVKTGVKNTEPVVDSGGMKTEVDRLLAELQRLNPDFRTDGVRINLAENGIWKIDLNDKPINNISPLTSLPISILNLSRTGISDLNALKNSKITDLYLDWTNVSDLSPLKGMPLKTLSIDGLQIKDFSILKDMPLENLNLADSNVKDISFLKGKQLKILSLKRTEVNDLTPLKGMKLQQLSLFETNFKSLKPIEEIPLEWMLISPRALNPEIYKTLKRMKTLKFISPGPDMKMPAEEFFRRFAWAEKGQQPMGGGGSGMGPGPGSGRPQQ